VVRGVLAGHVLFVQVAVPMPGPCPLPISVTPAQQTVLTGLLRRPSCAQGLAQRIKIIVGAASGQGNAPLARRFACAEATVTKWRGRWASATHRLLAVNDDPAALAQAIERVLADMPRPGAPATFTAEQIVLIVNLACRPPEQLGRPITAWTPPELADEAIRQGIVPTISARSVERFLNGGRSAAPSQPLLAQRQDQGGRPRRLC
jgi:putative transposase